MKKNTITLKGSVNVTIDPDSKMVEFTEFDRHLMWLSTDEIKEVYKAIKNRWFYGMLSLFKIEKKVSKLSELTLRLMHQQIEVEKTRLRLFDAINGKTVYFKDGTSIRVADGITWEYENDINWDFTLTL